MASTNWAGVSSESTNWAGVSSESTNWGNENPFSDFYLLLQNGTDALLYQDDETFIGLQGI